MKNLKTFYNRHAHDVLLEPLCKKTVEDSYTSHNLHRGTKGSRSPRVQQTLFIQGRARSRFITTTVDPPDKPATIPAGATGPQLHYTVSVISSRKSWGLRNTEEQEQHRTSIVPTPQSPDRNCTRGSTAGPGTLRGSSCSKEKVFESVLTHMQQISKSP